MTNNEKGEEMRERNLDPRPWQHYLGGRAARLPDINGWKWAPRPEYSQDREDYR